MTSDQSFPVKFSQAQRTFIAELLPAVTERLKLNEKNQRVILFTMDELKYIHQKTQSAIDNPQDGKKHHSMWHILAIACEAINKYQGIGTIPIAQRLFQFKITLKDTHPPIWRRIQVKQGTLDKFHEHIQTAMGWRNSHLHHFKIDHENYGDPELLNHMFDDFDYLDSRATMISEIVPQSGQRFCFEYEYDFGDCWNHEVLFEGCLRSNKGHPYPICLEGERTCPPEDVGGVRGYAEFVKAVTDPGHEEHDRLLEWSGKFDPDDFNAEKATKRMRRGLPDWRMM